MGYGLKYSQQPAVLKKSIDPAFGKLTLFGEICNWSGNDYLIIVACIFDLMKGGINDVKSKVHRRNSKLYISDVRIKNKDFSS